jgi:hypothetical protein
LEEAKPPDKLQNVEDFKHPNIVVVVEVTSNTKTTCKTAVLPGNEGNQPNCEDHIYGDVEEMNRFGLEELATVLEEKALESELIPIHTAHHHHDYHQHKADDSCKYF